jgi:hypothetical protein
MWYFVFKTSLKTHLTLLYHHMVYMVVLIEFDPHLQAHHYHAYYISHNHKVYKF